MQISNESQSCFAITPVYKKQCKHPKPQRMTTANPIDRQMAMALTDNETMYEYTVQSFPIIALQPIVAKTQEVKSLMEGTMSSDDENVRLILAQVNQGIERMNRAIAEAADIQRKGEQQLQTIIDAKRLAVFQRDFRHRGFQVKHGACTLCDDQGDVYVMDCCATKTNDATICDRCLVTSAFYSSKHGTTANAHCPLCRAEFPVYALAAPERR